MAWHGMAWRGMANGMANFFAWHGMTNLSLGMAWQLFGIPRMACQFFGMAGHGKFLLMTRHAMAWYGEFSAWQRMAWRDKFLRMAWHGINVA